MNKEKIGYRDDLYINDVHRILGSHAYCTDIDCTLQSDGRNGVEMNWNTTEYTINKFGVQRNVAYIEYKYIHAKINLFDSQNCSHRQTADECKKPFFVIVYDRREHFWVIPANDYARAYIDSKTPMNTEQLFRFHCKIRDVDITSSMLIKFKNDLADFLKRKEDACS